MYTSLYLLNKIKFIVLILVQFATLESVKAVSECYTPVAGKVVKVNESLQENPSQINQKPFDEGATQFLN